MFSVARAALNLTARGIRQVAVRRSHHDAGPDFHDKYGNVVLASGIVFCTVVWSYVATQTGIVWNFSPVGRVTPKEWRQE
ncbi:cytochrome c oxidase subunit 7B, mitochondrial [Latimeria chalumnae]|uniref:Cytochrome c oxidase subunit 7B, mitochondrial n=1 Tax=Latimeria chalumnae TaxID=7897 RepID=H3AVG1_LATCH|nr:PREDICTED: cytochrome c oxidase subunit 7B, mitochondrial [Latimeria chalumnae]|eukprot:XP_006000301.1 PREDICTED: cytochrome c oxidase subunit 7B, mitochondrial [Latimeria chalumnae]